MELCSASTWILLATADNLSVLIFNPYRERLFVRSLEGSEPSTLNWENISMTGRYVQGQIYI